MVYSRIEQEDGVIPRRSSRKQNLPQAKHRASVNNLITIGILGCKFVILFLVYIFFPYCQFTAANKLWLGATSNENEINDISYNQATQTFSHHNTNSINKLTSTNFNGDNSNRFKDDSPLYDDNNNKWVRDQIDVDSNEITDITQSFNEQNGPHKSHDYSCGRAVAMDRQRSHHRDYQPPRNKYRPFEIRMPRIIGGDETELGEFPWIASIKLNGQPICGGSLIDKSWVLTAAHCVVGYNPKNLTVRLGSYRIKDMTEVQSLELPVNMFIVHKDYSVPRPFSNDIALLKLSHHVRFTDYIIPVCLPYEDQLYGQMGNQMGSINGATGGSIITSTDDFRNQIMNNFGYDAMDPGALVSSTSSLGAETGIVVSTKMSDLDIAMCFNKLEQNYLASIGISPTPMASNEQLHQQQASKPNTEQPARFKPSQLTISPSAPVSTAATPIIPVTSNPSQAMSGSLNGADNNNIFSYHDVFNSILIPIEGDKKKITLFSPTTSSLAIDQEFNNDQTTSNTHLQQQQQSDYFSWTSGGSTHMNGKQLHGHQHQQQPATATATATAHLLRGRRQSESSGAIIGESMSNQAKSLHRLPISKELIKEIHEAASSNSMGPFASIGHSDIAAMASDLIQTTQHSQAQQQHTNAHNSGSGTIIPASLDLIGPASNSQALNQQAGSSDQNSVNYASSFTTSPNYREKITSSGGYLPSQSNGNNNNNNKLNSNNNNNNHLVDLGDGEGPSSGLSNDQMMDLNGIANNQLTSSAHDDPTRYAGLNGIVVGWGWIKELEADDANNTKGTPSVTLQKVRLPVLRNKVCESWFQSQSKKITLLPSQFCAGFQGGGKDACRGDSGGPMIIEDSTDTGRYKLIGIVSAGIGCARPSLPGLYTRVASFLPWINAQINRY